VKALRLAAAKLAPASSTDSTSFGLQCLMSPTATGTWRFRTQAFGEVELLAGVCDRHGRPLLGSPDEGKDQDTPRNRFTHEHPTKYHPTYTRRRRRSGA
ncbi:unnamed protein product, partial [Symbiodinium sp. KB8]